MTPVEIATALKDYGPWGLCGLLIGGLMFLFGRLQDSQDARITDAKLGTEALTRQASSNTEVAAMMAAIREGQTEVMRIVSLMQRDAEHDEERIKEKIEALTKVLDDMGRRIDQICRGAPR